LSPTSKKAAVSKNVNRVIEIPIAHGEGRFYCDEQELQKLEITIKYYLSIQMLWVM